jgi:hypothetical protein
LTSLVLVSALDQKEALANKCQILQVRPKRPSEKAIRTPHHIPPVRYFITHGSVTTEAISSESNDGGPGSASIKRNITI